MLAWIGPLLGLVPSALNTINGITTAISNEKIAVINAKTEQERIDAQERLSNLQSRRDVLIAESSKSNWNIYLRAIAALGPILLTSKIFIYDKTIGPFVGCVGNTAELQGCTSFNTDPLDPNLWYVVMVVLGFYFLARDK